MSGIPHEDDGYFVDDAYFEDDGYFEEDRRIISDWRLIAGAFLSGATGDKPAFSAGYVDLPAGRGRPDRQA